MYKRQGYVVQEAYKLDFINDMADSIGKSIQTLAGVTENGFGSTGFYAVSYTHLDVYKRQFKHLSEDCQEYYFDFEAYASHLLGNRRYPVSYTHLDVYKRQENAVMKEEQVRPRL